MLGENRWVTAKGVIVWYVSYVPTIKMLPKNGNGIVGKP